MFWEGKLGLRVLNLAKFSKAVVAILNLPIGLFIKLELFGFQDLLLCYHAVLLTLCIRKTFF